MQNVQTNFAALPLELLCVILRNLQPRDIVACERVCKNIQTCLYKFENQLLKHGYTMANFKKAPALGIPQLKIENDATQMFTGGRRKLMRDFANSEYRLLPAPIRTAMQHFFMQCTLQITLAHTEIAEVWPPVRNVNACWQVRSSGECGQWVGDEVLDWLVYFACFGMQNGQHLS